MEICFQLLWIINRWIISSCIGHWLHIDISQVPCPSHMYSNTHHLIIILIVLAFISIVKKSQRRINNKKMYEKKYLDLCNFRSQIRKTFLEVEILCNYSVSFCG